ncbi:glycoside hydrolase family 16 protein [Suhomyces tanzawaensis NRRL Y-17324]|uniref:Glycoside hydrolase family 16 protein n=1 Tax=Suhomyces tanzawaensis NRRL Y-17324 TaxID=984487 RepID=A0A1E4SIE9_9ASCO|nr:glycoside hydrolase family 16 protein [Suhomyces tanzawaensis NRRL Y-17324]ODV79227.1 glycoside hydrolase family 16 protein [Suhomyces tanzawaensis NRRL Y-17324]
MSQRDLTLNGPSEPRFKPNNPFASEQDSPDQSASNSSRNSISSPDTDSPYGKPFNVYNNHINTTHDSSANLLSQQSSANPLLNASYTSQNASSNFNTSSLPFLDKQGYYDDDDSRSSSESGINPFVQADFSPFGGYPASSFPLHLDEKEPDDYLHNPDPVADAAYENNRFIHDLKHMDRRALGGLVGLVVFALAAIVIFILLPVLTYSGLTQPYKPQTYEVLTHYHYPLLSAIRTSLVDPDTPQENRQMKTSKGETWELVFSDEFNAEGRTFYEGDDQFFTAPDLHYDATKDLEWYDPDAVTTANGTLNLRMDAYKNHNLFYRSGMVQSWNQMCFTQGYLDISARLPNYGNTTGLWPGLWSMGNLGRPGYLASTEGVWPYSYEACDAGITPNQSSPDGISYLPGQRLNSCTCSGEDHPNPGVGRGAPEIDALEGEVDTNVGVGVASQSLQLAPYDIWYYPDYDWVAIYNHSVTSMNTYTGGPLQQALSATTTLNTSWYERGNYTHNFQRYGFEYLNDHENGYLTWHVGGDPTLMVHTNALHPNGNVDWRRLSKEPMSLILNLGISNNWAYIDWPSIHFPVEMRVDYVRVYQPPDQINVGCDPKDFPTYDYIQLHLNLYYNANLTSFEAAGYKFPKNKLTGC